MLLLVPSRRQFCGTVPCMTGMGHGSVKKNFRIPTYTGLDESGHLRDTTGLVLVMDSSILLLNHIHEQCPCNSSTSRTSVLEGERAVIGACFPIPDCHSIDTTSNLGSSATSTLRCARQIEHTASGWACHFP